MNLKCLVPLKQSPLENYHQDASLYHGVQGLPLWLQSLLDMLCLGNNILADANASIRVAGTATIHGFETSCSNQGDDNSTVFARDAFQTKKNLVIQLYLLTHSRGKLTEATS